jgi:hypothetical protein
MARYLPKVGTKQGRDNKTESDSADKWLPVSERSALRTRKMRSVKDG